MKARATVPFGRRRFLLTAVAAAVAFGGSRGARPLFAAPVRRPREVPLAGLDLRAPHGLAG